MPEALPVVPSYESASSAILPHVFSLLLRVAVRVVVGASMSFTTEGVFAAVITLRHEDGPALGAYANKGHTDGSYRKHISVRHLSPPIVEVTLDNEPLLVERVALFPALVDTPVPCVHAFGELL